MSVVREDAVATGVEVNADVTQSGGLWARARAEMPLDALSAGSYVVIARVMSGEYEMARVSRPFTIR
jgi:hypothetical protein